MSSPPGKAAYSWDPPNTNAQGKLREKIDTLEKALYKPSSECSECISIILGSSYQALPAQNVNLMVIAWSESLFKSFFSDFRRQHPTPPLT